MTISVTKNASLMESDVNNSVNIQKVRSSFYNFVSQGSTAMSTGCREFD